MVQSDTEITIRDAQKVDVPFILSLSPSLTEVAKLDWHKDDTVQKFQDNYIIEMLAETRLKNITLIAEKERGTGIGKLLMEATENWAKVQGYRLLHLEVFSANSHARSFYQNMGFKQETIHMMKPLG